MKLDNKRSVKHEPNGKEASECKATSRMTIYIVHGNLQWLVANDVATKEYVE